MNHSSIYSFWYDIFVSDKQGGNTISELHWNNLTFDCRTKWNWYFDYRAALLKVKYPKSYIEKRWGSKEINNESPRDLQWRKLIARRVTVNRLVTKFSNAILKYENNERTKLIPDFENPTYLRTVNKLESYKIELMQIESQLKVI